LKPKILSVKKTSFLHVSQKMFTRYGLYERLWDRRSNSPGIPDDAPNELGQAEWTPAWRLHSGGGMAAEEVWNSRREGVPVHNNHYAARY